MHGHPIIDLSPFDLIRQNDCQHICWVGQQLRAFPGAEHIVLIDAAEDRAAAEKGCRRKKNSPDILLLGLAQELCFKRTVRRRVQPARQDMPGCLEISHQIIGGALTGPDPE